MLELHEQNTKPKYVLESYEFSVPKHDLLTQNTTNDAFVNVQENCFPGRMSIYIGMLLHLENIRQVKAKIVPINFEAYLFDKSCYIAGSPQFYQLRDG